MIELRAGFCVIAEPVRIPNSARWFASDDGRSAIRWNPEILQTSCVLVKKGRHFVAVRFSDVSVFSSYISPNLLVVDYLEFLEELSDVIHDLGGRLIFCGDYNAKSVLWGSPATDVRGDYVERWAAANDLRLANVGNSPTCVRPQGTSIVDLTWVSSQAVDMISDWTVREDLESMSDHEYITFMVGVSASRRIANGPDRSLSKMDRKAFALSLEWACSEDAPGDAFRPGNWHSGSATLWRRPATHRLQGTEEETEENGLLVGRLYRRVEGRVYSCQKALEEW